MSEVCVAAVSGWQDAARDNTFYLGEEINGFASTAFF